MDFIIDFWLRNPILVGGILLLLMFLNIHLLKEGNRLRNLGHAQFYKQEFYVSDPVIRKIIDENEAFSLDFFIQRGFILIIAIISSTLLMLKKTLPLSLLGDVGELCLGVIFCRYFLLIFNHLENRSLFLDILNHPDDLKGQIIISKSQLYNHVSIKNVRGGILWLVLFILVGRLLFLGGVFGALIQLYFVSKRER
ncbi:MAG: hypothetical protein ACFFAE_16700 [Candidatus Hodarchaeota archaeon]